MSDFDVSLTPAAAINVTVSGGVGPAGAAGAGGVATLQGLAGALTLAAVGGTWAAAGSTITLTVTSAGAVAWADITGKPATFAPSAHSHVFADVTGLQAALDAKAPIASPTFTGTVSGITKAMVGLSAVDNTADASKPVSTAQAAADAAVQAHAIQRANHTGTQAVGTITGLATVATSGAYADLSGAPAAYSLPTATASVLGGVKIGSGLTIDGSGVVTAAGTYTLPAATVSALGGVIVGAGLAVTSGTISVSYGTSSSTACVGDDARLSNARTPTAHASTHQTGGADAVANVIVTPTSLTADTNDWSIGTGDVFRAAGTAARNITGIAAGTSGLAILLINVGSFALTLKHQSASSTAANRFTVPWAGDCILAASGGNAVLVYDSTSSTWRVL
jgi:hypothetical protein